MRSRVADMFGVASTIIAAPMAGGPGTPGLVSAVARAGSFGFLAAGYKTPQAMTDEIRALRSEGIPFGVNLFAPNAVPVESAAFHRYAELIQVEADRYDLDLTGIALTQDEDRWEEKIDALLSDPVPVVSFTFGIPASSVLAALDKAGVVTVQTVTSVQEARAAHEAGVAALAVQSAAAGGHWGTLTPADPPAPLPLPELVAAVRSAVPLPLIAAGGVSDAGQVGGAVRAGADGVMVGTALLLTDEAGTSLTHRKAFTEGRDTVVTKAFTGRPARGLRNSFIDRYEESAPFGYPAVHYLTSPLRRAAAAAGDPERLHLWAGTGYRDAQAESVAVVLARLGQES